MNKNALAIALAIAVAIAADCLAYAKLDSEVEFQHQFIKNRGYDSPCLITERRAIDIVPQK